LRDAHAFSIPFDPRTRRAFEIEATSQNVSLDGLQALYRVLTPDHVPRIQALQQRVREAGRAARTLLAWSREALRDRLRVVAGDDLFFHRNQVKVLMDPVSGSTLEVMRWPWIGGDEWALWLEQFPHAELVISDAGTDVRAGISQAKRTWQADDFHERRWWWRTVFVPLSAQEHATREALERLEDRATRPGHPGRRPAPDTLTQAQRAQAAAEHDFFVMVRVEELLLGSFFPLDPHGALWTEETVEEAWEQAAQALVTLQTEQGKYLMDVLWVHAMDQGAGWRAHLSLWDHIPVKLAPEAPWMRGHALDALLRTRALAREASEPDTDAARRQACMREASVLHGKLRRWVVNLQEVRAHVRSLLRRVRRSSSLCEAFNSRLRVLQMTRRNVPDELLWLEALRWNLSPREDGPRRGRAPWEELGWVDSAARHPWYEPLLDLLAA
jgi:hypothetical protein